MDFLIIALWIVFSIGVGRFAEGRGKSFGRFLFISLILSPLIALIGALLIPSSENEIKRANARRGYTRSCIYCSEFVKNEALICAQCGRPLPRANYDLYRKALYLFPELLGVDNTNVLSAIDAKISENNITLDKSENEVLNEPSDDLKRPLLTLCAGLLLVVFTLVFRQLTSATFTLYGVIVLDLMGIGLFLYGLFIFLKLRRS
jgi:hypothetical protein